MRPLRHLATFSLLWLAVACAPQQPTPLPQQSTADPVSLPGWEQDDHEAALMSFLHSCEVFYRQDPTTLHGRDTPYSAPISNWQDICYKASHSRGTAKQFFEEDFVLVAPNSNEPGLFTGYYIPLIHGAAVKTPRYQYPVYGRPADWSRDKKHFTRAEIEDGALKHKDLEILWVDDPVALFFAHIQGSTLVELNTGEVIKLAYAGKNNHDYVSIGKLLKESGEMDRVTLDSLKAWMYANPKKAEALMRRNPTYVFFQKESADISIKGAQGAALTPERSLAVDPSYIPYGLPLYLSTTIPKTSEGPARPYQRLVIAQDTGGAIKGAIRGDVYFGSGERARILAGGMQQPGTYYLLLPHFLAPES